MNELISTGLITGSIGTFLGGFSGWFFRRRYEDATAKEKEADAKGKEIENEIKLSDHYKSIVETLEPRLKAQLIEIEELMKRKTALLEEEIKLKERIIKIQQKEIAELRRENSKLKNEYKGTA